MASLQEDAPSERRLRRVPVHYFGQLLDYVAAQGGQSRRVLDATGLRADALRPDGRVEVARVDRLLEAAEKELGAGFGLRFGLQLSLAAHGSLGFAVMASRSIGEALSLIAEFFRIRSPLVWISFVVADDEARMTIQRAQPLDRHDVLVDTTLGCSFAALRFLTQGSLRLRRVELARAVVGDEFARTFGCPVRSGCVTDALVFTRADLERPLPLGDATALAEARAACAAELARNGDDAGVAAQVRSVLAAASDGFPDADTVAARLRLSSRTLRRRLRDEGVRFQELADEERIRQALRWLGDTDESVQRIAERLGYADPSNFGHAFKRWTGQSPLTWRKARRQGD